MKAGYYPRGGGKEAPPGGFKSLDPARQATSAAFAQGVRDGADDGYRQSACPPIPALGPDPGCSWSYMYMAGYDRGYMPIPCSGCKNCRGGDQK